ncbi:MAG: hypothetical protein QXI61_06440 [Nitrososphaerota archaeon]
MDEDKIVTIRLSSRTHQRMKIRAALERITIKELIAKAFDEYCALHPIEQENLEIVGKSR